MGTIVDNLCNSCTNIGCEFQSGIVRTECAFYMPPHIEPDNCGNYVVMHPSKEGLKDTSEKELAIIEEEYISKADYNARLKADVVAMLEELNKEMNPIKECEHQIYGKEEWNFVGKCQDIIQQKINSLKESENK